MDISKPKLQQFTLCQGTESQRYRELNAQTFIISQRRIIDIEEIM